MKTRVLALAAAGVMVLTACGNDDALSEEEFLEQAKAICDEGDEAVDALFERLGEEPTEEQLDDAAAQAADIMERQAEDFRDLEGPEEIEDELDAAIEDSEAVVERMRDDGAVFFETFYEEHPFADVDRQFNRIGLTACTD